MTAVVVGGCYAAYFIVGGILMTISAAVKFIRKAMKNKVYGPTDHQQRVRELAFTKAFQR